MGDLNFSEEKGEGVGGRRVGERQGGEKGRRGLGYEKNKYLIIKY